MSLRAVSPVAVRRLAAAGAAAVALGGFLPHEICIHRPQCAVPWLSLLPLALAVVVLRRGWWTERLAVGFAAVVGVFWAAGLFLVLSNLARVTTDALYGTDFLGALHRFAAALYLYGATLSLAAVVVRESRSPVRRTRRAALLLAVVLAAAPLLGAVVPVVGAPDAAFAEGAPELVAVVAASGVGALLTALLARR